MYLMRPAIGNVCFFLLIIVSLMHFVDFNTANYKETNLEPVDRSATPVFRHYQVRPNQVDDDELNLQESQPVRQSSDWLSCVSRKTGLPRLFLSLVLLGCAVMMIWLCLAATVTAPDQKVKQFKVSTPPILFTVKYIVADMGHFALLLSRPRQIGEIATFKLCCSFSRTVVSEIVTVRNVRYLPLYM